MSEKRTVQTTKPTHPLQPLTQAEIEEVAAIANASTELPNGLYFEMIELKEPPKSVVRGFSKGDAIERRARVNMFPKDKIGVYRLVVSLDENKVLSVEHLPKARPMIQLEQFMEIEGAIKAAPDFIDACRKRGIMDMDTVCVDPWSAGVFDVEEEVGRHVCHTFAWQKVGGAANYYAHPIEGLNAVIDIKSLEVIRIDDYGTVKVPEKKFEYLAETQETVRQDLRAIDVVQLDGVSFQLDGHVLKWHEWELVIGFNARESLTLHDIRYSGRPVLYRASISEMVVPYGSPDGGHFPKNVFDIGEYGSRLRGGANMWARI